MKKNKQASGQLYVYMNGHHVGDLFCNNGQYSFGYTASWLENTIQARPISLSMPLSEKIYKNTVVLNYFDNLLPDNESIRQRIQQRFSLSDSGCFDLLATVGQECVGSLQLLTEPLNTSVKTIDAKPISPKAIEKLLKNYQCAPLGMQENSDFRISIAGAQEKTALLWHRNRWCLPRGETPTSHIIKLPIGYLPHAQIDLSDSVENEWLCLKVLAAFGLPVCSANIKSFNGSSKVLVVERFDRKWSADNTWLMRLVQEDMCQALGYSSALKYESDGGPGIADIMHLLQGSQQAMHDRYCFMKSVFIFWLLGAIDGHAKNFSIQIGAQGRYQLTPLYDVISSYPLAVKKQREWHDLKMAMAVKSKNRHYHWKKIQCRHWLAMAKRCYFPEETMQQIIEEIFDSLEAVIRQAEKQLPKNFPNDIALPIFDGMRDIKNKKYKF